MSRRSLLIFIYKKFFTTNPYRRNDTTSRQEKYPFVNNVFYSLPPKIFRVDSLTHFFSPRTFCICTYKFVEFTTRSVGQRKHFFLLSATAPVLPSFYESRTSMVRILARKSRKEARKSFFSFFFFFLIFNFQWNKKHSRFIATRRDIA